MPKKIHIDVSERNNILSMKGKSIKKISAATGFSIAVVRRVFADSGQSNIAQPKFPDGVMKKRWFNFDVYSNGVVFNINTGRRTRFKTIKSKRTINGKDYFTTGKRSIIYIRHEGVKKDLQISLKKLIAILFVKNPNNHQYVHYKEGGRNNCDYRNLYWSDKPDNSNRVKTLRPQLNKHYQKLIKPELHKSDVFVYDYYMGDISAVRKYLSDREQKRYFISIMIDQWGKLSQLKPNLSAINNIYDTFIDDVHGLIDRGFFAPKLNGCWFIIYCRKHIIGRLKKYLFRDMAIIRRYDEAAMPKHLLPKLISYQHHEFSE